jgi:hypothetical protein
MAMVATMEMVIMEPAVTTEAADIMAMEIAPTAQTAMASLFMFVEHQTTTADTTAAASLANCVIAHRQRLRQ